MFRPRHFCKVDTKQIEILPAVVKWEYFTLKKNEDTSMPKPRFKAGTLSTEMQGNSDFTSQFKSSYTTNAVGFVKMFVNFAVVLSFQIAFVV